MSTQTPNPASQQQQQHHIPGGPPIKPSPMRNLSEFAVADTPGTAGPEYASAGGDYLQCRFVPISSPLPTPPAVSQGSQGPQGTVDGGAGWGGPQAMSGGEDADADADAGADMQREMGTRRDAEGKGVGAVGGRGGGVESGTLRARARRGSMSVGGDGGEPGAMRSGVRGASPGGFHGRGRGEVTLGAGEADLERKKQQQAAVRKQLMDARKRGEDVDGRGTAGPSGRQPRAEID